MKIIIYFLIIFFIYSKSFEMTINEAFSQLSNQNLELKYLNKEIEKLYAMKVLTEAEYSEKFYFNINGQRDSQHLGDFLINDLNQKYFIDYSFSQTSYTLTYDKRIFDSLKENLIKINDQYINNKLFLLKEKINYIKNKIRLIFIKIYFLKKNKEILEEKKEKIKALRKVLKNGADLSELLSARIQALNVEENENINLSYSVGEKITMEINNLSNLLNKKINLQNIQIAKYEDITLENQDLESDVNEIKKFMDLLFKNNLNKNIMEVNNIQEQNRSLDIQLGIKHYDGVNILDISTLNIQSLRLSDSFTDNYGKGSFYRGFYGNDPNSGSLFYVNLTYNFIEGKTTELLKNKAEELEQNKISLSIEANDLNENLSNVTNYINISKAEITKHNKNIVALEIGLKSYVQVFKNGQVTLEQMIEYENHLYDEKINLNNELINLNLQFNSFFQVIDSSLKNLENVGLF